ncbi:ATPase [Emiliania huxleyi CCMP1516]|uniref:EF-hand domain-containing protein n=2 Tax=Emiliania huxleyi TaxID=2903 RepID=A0A0D3IEB0_EMIH1|nr:ATPase [Emiliania huxleyi CCMP1516]EOD09595.1 ATPase [Emiliania huxleyi CCMP1516]|eukprot:XP_005762024.1 ATPase [Emiliania huxleyi CCMP1516]
MRRSLLCSQCARRGSVAPRHRLLSSLPAGVSPSRGASPLSVVQDAIAAGILNEDPKQMAALLKLDALASRLKDWEPPAIGPAASESGTSGGGLWGSISSVFGGGGGGDSGGGGTATAQSLDDVAAPLGLYMYGGVGCGKSLIMDTFFDCVDLPSEKKRRVHFHEFMLEIHKRLHEHRQAAQLRKLLLPRALPDGPPALAISAPHSAALLCFDEFQVTDVADALVIRRLFHQLFSHGIVMVATSNRPPDDLYKNGLQRPLFVPFIGDLKQRCEVHDLDSPNDYRMLKHLARAGRTYMTPLGPDTDEAMDEFFGLLTKGRGTKPLTLQLRGRKLKVERAARKVDVARFGFDELCGKPLGAEDYLGLASAFHTIFVESVPQLSFNDINRVRRFITLIDSLYEKRTLYAVDEANSDESFAFDRTVSRLNEMSSSEYLIRSISAHEKAKGTLLVYESDSAPAEQGLAASSRRALEIPELRLLMMDLSERMRGHRNVEDAEVEHAFALMDANGNGEVTQYEFTDVFANSSLTQVVAAYGETLPENALPQPSQSGRINRDA